MSYYFHLNISKKLSTIWTEMQLINWIPWWSMCGESGFATAQNGNFSSNLWSVLKMAAHGRFNVQRWFKIASFDANGSFGICRTHSKTLRRRKYSKNIVFVPKLSCTSSPFYLTCPDPDGGIGPASSFANYLVPAVFDLGAMHLFIVDSLSLSRSSGGRCLREDAMHITSLCGQFIKFRTGAAANEAKQGLSSVAVRYHLNTIHLKMHEKWFSKRQFTCNYL